MDFSKHTTSSNLERYAFYWLLALLVFSAAALFLGARPPITLITGYYNSTVWSLLDLSWVVCGVAAVYLTYQWVQNQKQVFGGTNTTDVGAFWFMILSGYNLGIVGVLGINLYFEIAMGMVVYVLTGVISLGVAGYLYKRWQENGHTLFGSAQPSTETSEHPPAEQTTPHGSGN